MRRCKEPREDFTAADNANVFPIQMQPGGNKYGFCPAKATWDPELAQTFNRAVLSYEMKLPLVSGGLDDQPEWWIELMSEFIQIYEQAKFISRAKMILGDGKSSKGAPSSAVGQKRGAALGRRKSYHKG